MRLSFHIMIGLLSWFSTPCLGLAVADDETLLPIREPQLAERAWRVTNLTTDAGLYRKQIRAAAFAQDGTIWLGAGDGVYRYDGYTHRRFGIEDGVPDDFIQGLFVDPHGTLWISSTKGVATFDSQSERFVLFDGLAGQNIGAIYEDDAGTLWFCSKAKGLVSLTEGKLRFHDQQDGLPSSEVSQFYQDSQGRRFALTTRGLAQQNDDGWFLPLADSGWEDWDASFRSVAESDKFGVLFTTDRSLFVLKDNAWSRVVTDRTHQLLRDHDGSVLSIAPFRHWADFNFAFHRWKGTKFVRASPAFRLSKNWSYWQGLSPDGSVWMASYNRLIRWTKEDDEWRLYDRELRPQFEDADGRIWFSGQATAAVLDGNDWFSLDNVSWPFQDNEGKIWFHSPLGEPDGLTVVTDNRVERIPVNRTGLVSSQFMSMDGIGTAWVVGRDDDDVACVSSFGSPNWVTTPCGSTKQTCLAMSGAQGGGVWMILADAESCSNPVVVGVRNNELLSAPPLPALPAIQEPNNEVKLLCDDAQRLWLKCVKRVLLWDIESSSEWIDVTQETGSSVYGWTSQGQRTWFAVGSESGGKSGLVSFEGSDWDFQSSNEPSWFDRWDLKRSIIGCDSQFIAISQPQTRRISLPFEDSAFNGLVDRQGAVWLSVRDGLLKYQSDGVPPRIEVLHADRFAEAGEQLRFDLKAATRFQPKNQLRIQFQRQINDRGWSEMLPLSELKSVASNDLGPGEHRVSFRAVDEAGDFEPDPVSFVVKVLTPIWKRTWFVLLITSLLGTVVLQSTRVFQRGKKIRATTEELKKQELLAELNRVLEQKVEERTAALRDSNEELKGFAHSVSHDLRAPLRAMEGFATALSDDYAMALDETAGEYISNIVDSAKRMDDLINDLLDYSRVSRAELSLDVVSLADAVRAAVRNLQADIAASHANVQVIGKLHSVFGHHSTIVQIMQNLISNGIKFVKTDVLPDIQIYSQELDNGKVRLTCADNGVGIDLEYQKRIFSVFERLHGILDYEGTGIGLAIVSRACHRLGGSCGVSSVLDQGSRFWIELPMVPK